MVLNGDIVEYENIGPVEDGTQGVGIQGTDVEYAAIELLINFMELAAMQLVNHVMRLSGGGIKRQKSFRMAPVKPYRQRHFTDNMEIDTPLEIRAWRAQHEPEFPGVGRRYVEGLGDSTESVRDFPWRPPIYSPLSIQGRLQNRFFRDLILDRMMTYGSVGAGATLGTLRLTYPGYGPGGKQPVSPIPPDFYSTLTDQSINEMPMNGNSMLSLKNSLTRMYKTHLEYNMSPVLVKGELYKYKAVAPGWEKAGLWNHSTFEGTGPHLYSVFDQAIITGTAGTTLNRSMNTWELKAEDQGYWRLTNSTRTDENLKTNRALGIDTIVYVFAADWPFTTMNLDVDTQVDKYKPDEALDLVYASQLQGNYLKWKSVDYKNTTDMNTPVLFEDIWNKNKDWTYLTHYYTKYWFRFRNTSRRPYVVEILFFTFKADVDAMDYEKQCLAVVNRQNYKYQDYIDGISPASADTNIVYRKRIVIGGIDTLSNNLSTSLHFTDKAGRSQAIFKYVVKRKYVIKKPILNINTGSTGVSYSENQAFNEYYEHQSGTYCRMQAWPLNPGYYRDDAQAAPRTPAVKLVDDEDAFNVFNGEETGTRLGFGIQCKIDKKSYFKLDEPFYKSYTTS